MAIRYVQRPFAITTSVSNRAAYTQESGTTSDNRVVVVHTVTDDASGGFIGDLGTVNYAGKTANLRVVRFDRSTTSYKADHEDATGFEIAIADGGGSGAESTWKGGTYGTAAVGEEMFAGSSLVARYRVAPATPQARVMTVTPPAITFDLCPYTSDAVVPGSVQFTWMGQTFMDFEGKLYRDRTGASPGIESGTIDYASGLALITDFVVGPGGFFLQSLWTRRMKWKTASIFFRTQSAPIKPSGFVLNLSDSTGAALTATGGLDGTLAGDHMRGRIDYASGVVELQFGDYVLDAGLTAEQKTEWWYSADDVGAVQAGKIWRPWPVDPTTLRYNSVAYFYLPLDADILGLDPVRLPPDGRVPIFRVGGYVVIGHTGTMAAATFSNGQTIDCARTRLARVTLIGNDGALINTGYTTDLDAGTISVLDTTGWSQPVTVEHRIEQMARVTDVRVPGGLTINKQLSHEFPAGSTVSSALMVGNLKARVQRLFDQQTWNQVSWSDTVDGNPAPATFNDTAYPVVVSNRGALTQRFAIYFTNTTDFNCVGENVGFIGSGTKNADFSPVNPMSGTPYFTLRSAGWGGGWAVGNTLFLHTVGGIAPHAVIRTVQPSDAVRTDYKFELITRGDVDRPPSD